MSSPAISLAEIREATYSTVVYSANDAAYKPFLNQLLMRFVDSGEWHRSNFSVELPIYDGYFTLPRRAAALVGVRFSNFGVPRTIYPQAHEFSEVGPGEQDPSLGLSSVYEGPDVCTQRTLAEGTSSLLSLSSTNAEDLSTEESPLIVRIFGVGADGRRLFDSAGNEGLAVALSGTTIVTTSVAVALLDRITLPVTKGFVILKDAANTVLSTYEPGETAPSYRRYKIGAATADQTAIAFCTRRFVPVTADTDPVFPSNVGAIKLGLTALRLEDTGDLSSALDHFAAAYALLNNESRKQRGAAKPTARFVTGVRRIPALH